MKAVDFIGSEFKTPKGGVLKVHSLAGKANYGIQLFNVSCSICSLDTELFSDYFTTTKAQLTSGRCPCPCSRMDWTESHNIIRLKRLLEPKNISLNGWFGSYNHSNTKVDCTCNTCGLNWTSTTISCFVKQKSGCPSCNKAGYITSKSGTFYVVKWINEYGYEWIKYGITNKTPRKRFLDQKGRLKKYNGNIINFHILSLHYFDDGSIPQLLEKLVKPLRVKYPSGITKEDMEDGYTETLSIDALLELNEIILPYKNNNKEQ